VGVFQVPIILRNWQNRFLPEAKRGEELRCMATVDSGAAELALPADMIERLKLTETGRVRAYTAEAGKHELRVFGIISPREAKLIPNPESPEQPLLPL
jgi:hypothetical protein